LKLEDLGWDAFFADAFEPYELDNLIPARVSARHHGPCELLSERGRLGGIPSGNLSDEELPAVGDWVAVRPVKGERKAVIEAVLPRRSAFKRKEAWRRTVEQIVAANIDTVLVVTAFGGDLNPRRLERYLTAAWDSGATPVIVVNKSDVAEDPAAELLELEPVAVGVPVLSVSAVTGDGLDELEPYLGRGRTIALLGSSGVGKSTLVNRFVGRELLATAETSADGRGRHTTVSRHLFRLPGGALLVDTPGLREVQLWEADEGIQDAFSDVDELAAGCRFNDCAHLQEPGCAVQAAIDEGTLPRERLQSYRALQRELRHLAVKQDARLRSEERKKRVAFARSLRKTSW